MNLEPKAEIKSATRVSGGPATPRKGPPKFKQRQTRQFKSKPPKKGVQGWVALLSFPDSDTNEVRICNGFVSPQLWWWYPRHGGFRNRWGHPPRVTSDGLSIEGLEHCIYFWFLCFRYHCHLPLGGLQSPGAARAGSVRHHLSLSRMPPAILWGF